MEIYNFNRFKLDDIKINKLIRFYLDYIPYPDACNSYDSLYNCYKKEPRIFDYYKIFVKMVRGYIDCSNYEYQEILTNFNKDMVINPDNMWYISYGCTAGWIIPSIKDNAIMDTLKQIVNETSKEFQLHAIAYLIAIYKKKHRKNGW